MVVFHLSPYLLGFVCYYFFSGLLWASHFNATVPCLFQFASGEVASFQTGKFNMSDGFQDWNCSSACSPGHLHTIIYNAARKFLSAKHFADQKRQVSLLPGFQTEGKQIRVGVLGEYQAKSHTVRKSTTSFTKSPSLLCIGPMYIYPLIIAGFGTFLTTPGPPLQAPYHIRSPTPGPHSHIKPPILGPPF